MQATAAPRLVMQGIRKSFGGTIALGGVDFEVYPGQVLALVGENGAGKSTLMKVLSGAIKADGGQMMFEGQPYAPRHPLEARKLGVAMIYQELSLTPHMSVADNICLGMEPGGAGLVNHARMRDLARQALAELGHENINPRTRVDKLSVAQQQIVEIARALTTFAQVGGGSGGGEPQAVIVLDEPTSSLTRGDVEHLFIVIDKLRQRGFAIVYISHFLEEVLRLADRYVVLRDGHTVGQGVIKGTTTDDLVAQMVGRKITELYPRSPHRPGQVLLQLDDLSGRAKPRSANLTLRSGEVLGIAGLVGAGRTELLRTVFGLEPVREGKVQLGTYSGSANPARRWQQGMGMLSEDRKSEGLALTRSIADNLTLSSIPGWGLGTVSPRRQMSAAKNWVRKLAVKCAHPGQRIGDLSGGNQQKVAMARLLHHDVNVLLLDEPTRGIDVGSKAQIYKLIDELACQGKAVLLVSSYLPELLGVCDRIAVMSRGRIGAARPTEEWTQESLMAEATGKEEA